jgi:hypothetical protein
MSFYSQYFVIYTLSCIIQVENILDIHDVPNIWHVPLILRVSFYFSLRLSVDHLEEPIELVWIVSSHCSGPRFLTCAVFQNQKAHDAIIKQLNLARWARQLLIINAYECWKIFFKFARTKFYSFLITHIPS